MAGFNPRAREGRDRCTAVQSDVSRVSIHAPARGATSRVYTQKRYASVSIHAPARGATGVRTSMSQAVRMFQSTRPRGARQHCGQRMS